MTNSEFLFVLKALHIILTVNTMIKLLCVNFTFGMYILGEPSPFNIPELLTLYNIYISYDRK